MKNAPMKVLLAAIPFYAGAIISNYIARMPAKPDMYMIVSDADPWSNWDYLSLPLLVCAIGLTIAGIKLLR